MQTQARTSFSIVLTALCICMFYVTACKSKQAKTKIKVIISGTVTQTSTYCGGARPTDEMLEELQTPRIYPGKKFYVIAGDTNLATHKIILSFVTDEKGNFSFELEPGTYSLIVDEQAAEPDAKQYLIKDVVMDEACFKKWWATPYCVLKVSSAPFTPLKFNFHKACFVPNDIPCLKYIGLPRP